MSHHANGYRIFADDETNHTNEEWRKAYDWINGLEFRKDYNEAFSLAKICAVSCRFPFVVQYLPIGGKRPEYTDTWVVNP